MNIGIILFWYILITVPYRPNWEPIKFRNADRTIAIFKSKSNCQEVAKWLMDNMNKSNPVIVAKCYPEHKKKSRKR